MAQDRVAYNLTANSKAWTLLTDANVTSVTFTVEGGVAEIMGQNGTSTPAETESGHTFHSVSGEVNRSLADLFPGASTPNRLYARALLNTGGAKVVISHA